VICGKKASKQELRRVVAGPESTVLLDATGKLPGRGAYVCPGGNCGQKSLDRRRIEHALRTKMNDEQWAELLLTIEAEAQTRSLAGGAK
jgi:predicted RNA-binding protein YlxR (DUF448 family)